MRPYLPGMAFVFSEHTKRSRPLKYVRMRWVKVFYLDEFLNHLQYPSQVFREASGLTVCIFSALRRNLSRKWSGDRQTFKFPTQCGSATISVIPYAYVKHLQVSGAMVAHETTEVLTLPAHLLGRDGHVDKAKENQHVLLIVVSKWSK